jgi:hypothetical protein
MKGGTMSKTATDGQRIAGSVVGLLAGDVSTGDVSTSDPSLSSFVLITFGSPAALPGAIFGAVAAAMANTVLVGIAVSARRQQVDRTDSIPLGSLH